jgi:hypothetical protein
MAEELTGRVTGGTPGTLPESQQCKLSVEGEAGELGADGEGGCEAVVECGWHIVYRGRGGCGQFHDQDVLYWDGAPSSEDGTPALVIAEHSHYAALRDDDGRELTLEVRDPD